MARTSKGTKRDDMALIPVGSMPLVVGAPYMTAEQWAEKTGMTREAVRKRLAKGDIARYQPVAGGIVFVNVIAEMKKAMEAPAY